MNCREDENLGAHKGGTVFPRQNMKDLKILESSTRSGKWKPRLAKSNFKERIRQKIQMRLAEMHTERIVET